MPSEGHEGQQPEFCCPEPSLERREGDCLRALQSCVLGYVLVKGNSLGSNLDLGTQKEGVPGPQGAAQDPLRREDEWYLS